MKASPSLLHVIFSRKMAALSLLGFSSGLPLFLTGRSLQAWMTTADVDISRIGLFSLVALPYSLKFLWAPLMERFIPPFLGRRRGWLLLTQMGLILAIGAMSFQDPKQDLQWLAVNALVLAFFSASQDIVVDAYRTDILAEPEIGAGTGIYVAGYRGALIVSGALALFLADRFSWNQVYLLMAALMVVGLVTTFWAPEAKLPDRPPETLAAAIVTPIRDILTRMGIAKTLVVLVFVVFYRYGDALAGNMTTSFLLKGLSFTQTDVGLVLGVMGLAASIVGALLGGAVISRIGINRGLWIFGITQALSNLAASFLAQVGKSYPLMVLAINIENLCGGLAIAALFAFLLSLCSPKFSGPQYALLSSLMAASSNVLAAGAGDLAKAQGWPIFFLITMFAAFPAMALLPFIAPWNPVESPPRPGIKD